MLKYIFEGFSTMADYSFQKVTKISSWRFKNIPKMLVKQATMFLLVKVGESVVNFKVWSFVSTSFIFKIIISSHS